MIMKRKEKNRTAKSPQKENNIEKWNKIKPYDFLMDSGLSGLVRREIEEWFHVISTLHIVVRELWSFSSVLAILLSLHVSSG
jgi:hypothetical protein